MNPFDLTVSQGHGLDLLESRLDFLIFAATSGGLACLFEASCPAGLVLSETGVFSCTVALSNQSSATSRAHFSSKQHIYKAKYSYLGYLLS